MGHKKNKKFLFSFFLLLIIWILILFLLKFNWSLIDNTNKKISIKVPEKVFTLEEKHFLSNCDSLQASQNLLTTFQEKFQSEFTTENEKKIYDNVIVYLQEGKKYQDFENNLIISLSEADWDEAKKLRGNIHMLYQFFYTQEKWIQMNCIDTLEKYYK